MASRPRSKWRYDVDKRVAADALWPYKVVIADVIELDLRLPRVHAEARYVVQFVMNREHKTWEQIAAQGVLDPPETIPGNKELSAWVRAYGALYFASPGSYWKTEILADGVDRRRVPLQPVPYPLPGFSTVPRDPKLEMTATAERLVNERGYKLEIEARLLGTP